VSASGPGLAIRGCRGG